MRPKSLKPERDVCSNNVKQPVPSRRKVSKVIKSTMKDYARTMKKLA
jgi:hypothetical protein